MITFRNCVKSTGMLCSALLVIQQSTAADGLSGISTNGRFHVILPGAAETNEFRMLEWSTDLINWDSIILH